MGKEFEFSGPRGHPELTELLDAASRGKVKEDVRGGGISRSDVDEEGRT